MPDFVILTCPSCGAKLEITKDIKRFACGFCGNEHVVKRGGGIISIIPIADDTEDIKKGVNKTASDLSILRIKKEIEELETNYTDEKRQILNSMLYNGKLIGFGPAFLRNLYFRTGRDGFNSFDLDETTKLFLSISDEDIIYSLTHWNEFWQPKDIEKSDIVSIYNGFIEIRKLIDKKEETLHQKEAELETIR